LDGPIDRTLQVAKERDKMSGDEKFMDAVAASVMG
jgi:hypothetical protein